VWQREDYFLDSFGGWEKNGLYRLKTLYPDYIWFFSHLIGQLPLLIKNSRLEERDHWNSWRSHWQKGLEGIRWISLHDIFSARFSKVGKKMKTVYSSENLSKDEILKLVFAREDEIAVTDHLTYQLMPNTRNKRLLLWQLNPDQMQIIEATTNIEV
ncbi:MAG: hypothetical protein KDD35_10220, partial [Bdellovibrionales bacterium]|nr:hypothetical protein [Bdellovibrionales bacterium]